MQGLYFRFTRQDAITLFYALIGCECLLVLVYLLNSVLPLPATIFELIDLDGEANIPAWFSSLQLALIGLLFLLNACRIPKPDMKTSLFFLIIGLGFIFLSMDEAVGFHEKITTVFASYKWVPRFKGNHGVWVPVYAVISCIGLILLRDTLLPVVRAKPKQWRLFTIGVFMLFIGGVLIEIISYQFLRTENAAIFDTAAVAIEEFLEMSGASVMLYAVIGMTLSDLPLPELALSAPSVIGK